MYNQAVRMSLIWLGYQVRFVVKKQAVGEPFWYAVKEEPSRKEQMRKPKGSTVTSSGSSETLQPVSQYAVRKVQDSFISERLGRYTLSSYHYGLGDVY